MNPLKQTDYDVFSFLERTPDLVCIADKQGFFRKVNQSVIDTLEYSREGARPERGSAAPSRALDSSWAPSVSRQEHRGRSRGQQPQNRENRCGWSSAHSRAP